MEEKQDKNMRDLGCANGWSDDSIECRLVEMTRQAGYKFKEEFIPPHTFRYTCKEAGLAYHTICS